MTVLINPVIPSTDNFSDWWTKTNAALAALSNVAVTVNSNTAVGVAGINGTFFSNVIYTASLNGGTNGAPGLLTVATNTSFSANVTMTSNVAFGGTNNSFTAISSIYIPGSNTINKFVAANSSTGKMYFANLLTEMLAVDGAGSTLDADLLDGQQGTYYNDLTNATGILPNARLGNTAYSNVYSLQVNQNLTAYGNAIANVNFISSNTDWIGAPTGTGAVYLRPSGIANATNQMAVSQSTVTFNGSTIWHAGNDGTGSTLDSDLLDGQHGTYYNDLTNATGTLAAARFNDTSHGARANGNLHAVANSTANGFFASTDKVKLDAITYSAADVLSKLLTVDGAGSGIDADLLDGQNSTYYTDIVTRLGYTPLSATNANITVDLAISNTNPTVNLYSTASGSAILIQNQGSGVLNISNTTTIQQLHTSTVSNTVNIVANTATLIHQFPKATFRGGKYVMSIVNNNANAQTMTELLVVHNTGDAMLTEYAQLHSNTGFTTFSANTDATNVRLYLTSSSNSAAVKFSASLL